MDSPSAHDKLPPGQFRQAGSIPWLRQVRDLTGVKIEMLTNTLCQRSSSHLAGVPWWEQLELLLKRVRAIGSPTHHQLTCNIALHCDISMHCIAMEIKLELQC